MRIFKHLSDIDMKFSMFSGLAIGRIFQSIKYYLQLFVLANLSLLTMKDFVSRMYYFNCFSFFLGFLMSKYILAEELAQTAVTFANDLVNLYNSKVSGMLHESIDKFKTTVKNVLEKEVDFETENLGDSKTENLGDSKTENLVDSKTENLVDSKTENLVDSKIENLVDSNIEEKRSLTETAKYMDKVK
jgi:hypothetical protein